MCSMLMQKRRGFKFQTAAFPLILALCLLGCSPKTASVAWRVKNVSLASYTAYEILPVADATGEYVNQEILDYLTDMLKKQFARKRLQPPGANHSQRGVLTVQSEILAYEIKHFKGPSLMGAPFAKYSEKKTTAECSLLTLLIDKSSGEIVTEVLTSQKIFLSPGLFSPKNKETVLRKSAEAVANEVANMQK